MNIFLKFFLLIVFFISIVNSQLNICKGYYKVEANAQTNKITLKVKGPEEPLRFDWFLSSSIPFPTTCTTNMKGTNAQWKSSHTSHITAAAQLDPSQDYFATVRVVLDDGSVLFLRSDAFKPTLPPTSSSSQQQQQQQQSGAKKLRQTYSYESCPIDEANRCNEASVTSKLNDIYGEADYSDNGPAALVFRSEIELGRMIYESSSSGFRPDLYSTSFGVNLYRTFLSYGDVIPDFLNDPNIDQTPLRINARQVDEANRLYHYEYDDDEGHPQDLYEWIIAPGLGGIALFASAIFIIFAVLILIVFVLVVAILLLVKFVFNGSDDGPSLRPFSTHDEPDEPSAFDRRAKAGAGSADDRTNVEFPDTEIRRLSITHEDQPSSSAASEPKRKHPIMESSSSSFRDFRSANV